MYTVNVLNIGSIVDTPVKMNNKDKRWKRMGCNVKYVNVKFIPNGNKFGHFPLYNIYAIKLKHLAVNLSQWL